MLLELWTGTHRAYKGHLDKDRAVSEQADCPALLLNSYKIWGSYLTTLCLSFLIKKVVKKIIYTYTYINMIFRVFFNSMV